MSDNDNPESKTPDAPAATTPPTEPSEPVSFLNSIPEDLRKDSTFEGIKDLPSLAKSYVHAQRLVGSSIRIPGEEAGADAKNDFYGKLQTVPGVVRIPEESDTDGMAKFYTKLGRPEKAEDYKLDIEEGLSANPEQLKSFTDYAFELGLTNKQASKLVGFEVGRHKNAEELFAKSEEQYTGKLKHKWGPEYDNILKSTEVVAQHYAKDFPDEMANLLNSTERNNPAFRAMLSDLSKSLVEGGKIPDSNHGQFGLTSEKARQTIDEMRSNKEHPYNNPSDPGHERAVEKMTELYYVVHPKK